MQDKSRKEDGGAAEPAAEIKPQHLIRLIPSEGVFPKDSAFAASLSANRFSYGNISERSENLSELIAEQSIATAGLAVAIGLRVIRRDEWDATPVADQAEITLIRATQGG